MLKRLILVCVLVGLLYALELVLASDRETYAQTLAYSVDGQYLAIGYDNGLVAVYKVNGTRLGSLVFEAKTEAYLTVFFKWNPIHSSQLLYVSGSWPILVYDMAAQTGEQLIYTKDVGGITDAEWLKDGDRIIVRVKDSFDQDSIEIFSVASDEHIVIDTFNDSSDVLGFAINPAGTKVLIRRTRTRPFNRAYVRSLTDFAAPIEYDFPLEGDLNGRVAVGAEWTSQALLLLTEDSIGSSHIQIHNPNTYEKALEYISEKQIFKFALRPGTSQVALSDRDGVRIFDWIDQQIVGTIESSDHTSEARWSPDGHYLAYSAGGNVYIREIPLPVDQIHLPTITPSPTLATEECFKVSSYNELSGTIGSASEYHKHYTVCFPEYASATVIASDGLARLHNIFGPTLITSLTKDVVIEGNGVVIERSEGITPFRFFVIAPGGHLTLRNMTLRGGYLDEGNGGAILNQGRLTLENVIFENNAATNGSGGAIYNDGGIIEGTYTILQGNTAGVSGGALVNAGGTVTLHQSCVIENTAVDGLAIEQQDSATTDASGNWWGSSAGPEGQVGSSVKSEGFLTSEMGLCTRAAPEPTLTPAPTNTPVPTITPLVLEEITPVLFPSPFWTAAPEATATP